MVQFLAQFFTLSKKVLKTVSYNYLTSLLVHRVFFTVIIVYSKSIVGFTVTQLNYRNQQGGISTRYIHAVQITTLNLGTINWYQPPMFNDLHNENYLHTPILRSSE